MARPLIALSGARTEDVIREGEERRYAGWGLWVLLISVWTTVCTSAALVDIKEVSWWAAVPLGLLVAALVAVFDRLVLGTSLLTDGLVGRLKLLLPRLLVAVALGLFLGHTSMLWVYSGDIDQRIAEQERTALREYEAFEAASTEGVEIARLRAEIGTADQAAAAAGVRADEALAAAQCEYAGCPGSSGVAGDGDLSRLTAEAAAAAAVDREAAQQAAAETRQVQEAEIDRLQQAIDDRRAEFRSEQASADEFSTRSRELWEMVGEDWSMALIALVFLAFDLGAVLMKVSSGASGVDLAARERRELRERQGVSDRSSSDIQAALMFASGLKAERLRREAEEREQYRPSRAGGRWRLPAWAGVAGATLLVLTLAATFIDPPTWAHSAERGPQVVGIDERTNVTWTDDAVSGDHGVEAGPASEDRALEGFLPLTDSFELSTDGRLDQPVVLEHRLDDEDGLAAESGLVTLTFWDEAAEAWTPYPVDYDAMTGLLRADLTHFSTWRFWEWDVAGFFAGVKQGWGEFIGRRVPMPECKQNGNRGPQPSWVAQVWGLSGFADNPIRGCAEGEGEGEGELLVAELANNRPYGQLLVLGSDTAWTWTEPPSSVADGFRVALGNLIAKQNGALYLPPLSRASVAIRPMEQGATAHFFIAPSKGTLAVDVLTLALSNGVGRTVGAGLDSLFVNYAGELARNCAGLFLEFDTSNVGDTAGLADVVLGDLADCLGSGVMQAAFQRLTQQGGSLTPDQAMGVRGALDSLGKASRIGAYAQFFDILGQMADLIADSSAVGIARDQGWGFSVRAQRVEVADDAPASTTSPEPVAGPQPPQEPPAPSPPPGPQPAPRPAPTPAPNPVPAPRLVPTPQPEQPPARERRLLYDNYGSGAVGRAMCSGNPGRPESMPGGTASQSFTVPRGVTNLTGAVVQVDPAPQVTVTAALVVGGAVRGTAVAAAAGDTRFDFGRVPVVAGETVTLRLTFSATSGKIITVYTVGAPGGTFTAANSCSDGAPDVTVTDTGLRARVEGSTA